MCLGSHSSGRPVLTHSFKREAEQKYKELLEGYETIAEGHRVLVSDTSQRAGLLRGVLLGWGDGQEATWDDLFAGRVMTDLLPERKDNENAEELADKLKGVQGHGLLRSLSESEKHTEKNGLEYISDATDALLKGYAQEVKDAFYTKGGGERIPKAVLTAMFGFDEKWMGVGKQVNLAGDDHSVHFRHRVIRRCWQLAKKKAGMSAALPKVTKDIATEARQMAIDNPQENLHALMDNPDFHGKFKKKIESKYLDKRHEDEDEETETDFIQQRPSKKRRDNWSDFQFATELDFGQVGQRDPAHRFLGGGVFGAVGIEIDDLLPATGNLITEDDQ